ncbi:MAG: TAXI family TRAP transporter solute-binding subunit [Beijerinckiaceae bacterium]
MFGRTIGSAVLAIGFGAAGAALAQEKTNISFGSGTQGGSQYPVTVAMGQVLEKSPKIGKITLQPGGSVGNIIRVDSGKSLIAISMSQSLREGRLGNKPFKKKTDNVVNLMTLHAFHVVVLVADESPIKTFKDFAGKKLNIAPKGFSVRELGERYIAMEGLKGKVDVGSLRIGEAVESFKDGHHQGLMYAPSVRFGPFLNLAQSRSIRLIQMDEKLMADFVKSDPSFYVSTWPQDPKAYPKLTNTAKVLAYPNVIVASTKLTEELAYTIVKQVAENFDPIRPSDQSLQAFDVKDLARDAGSPFHPGAMRYYKERGWMK